MSRSGSFYCRLLPVVSCALLGFTASASPAEIPSPRSHFGHAIGADRTTLEWNKVVSYFQRLAASSERMRIEELGPTTEGRPMIVSVIASPETLRKLDRYRQIQSRLADPRRTSEAEAERLIAEGKTVVLVTCSIHSTEIASTHTAVQFAYDLLTGNTQRLRAILENTILLLVPSLNPDGVDLVTGWYRKTLGTPYEGTAPPELYHKYVGHDNNRDWYIFSQAETRLVVSRLHNVWHPQVVYDVHQQGPYASRMFVPPWMDPIEPNVDAILMQETNMIGTAMAADLTAAGKTGIAIHAAYDFWTPARHYQVYHGGLRILTESASARLASPIQVDFEQLDRTALGYNAQQRSWNFLEPWTGGIWRLADIVAYQRIAMESCLYQSAIHRSDLLRNFYRVAQRQIARSHPRAFIVPAEQTDPGATRKLLQTLEFGMVEIERAEGGAYVIHMAQPYSGFAKALLERQQYPDLRLYPGGPPRRPYDVTAHTLPLLMGVRVEEAGDPLPRIVGRISLGSERPRTSFRASDTDAWYTINRIWRSGGSVWRNFSTGDFAGSDPGAGWRKLARPRIGLYRSSIPVIDEGWTRWLLEEFGFAYESVRDRVIRAGDLRSRFDVLVFPDQPAAEMDGGWRARQMPDEYTGGLGEEGAASLRRFAESGGTLLFLNRATDYARDRLGVNVRSVTRGLSETEFYAPGSLLAATLDSDHPLALGLPARISIWSEHSPAWETQESQVATYPESRILASGWLLGERHIAGKAALVDARLGAGHAILFGMRPQYRAQSYQTFKLFFNALLYGSWQNEGAKPPRL